MALELRSHLQEAHRAGKSVESVVGDNLEAFAADWASEYGTTGSTTGKRRSRLQFDSFGLWAGAVGIAALVILVAVFGPQDDTYNTSQWTAVWLVAAGLLAVGEMLTAGFFLLPFAVGAASAGVLAIAGVGIPLQFTVFVVVSILFLWLLQRFASKDFKGELLAVGAARYIGATAIVTEPVERLSVSGRVNMGTEDWRATTDSDKTIAPGTEVRVVEVRGARLVVEPAEK